MSVIVTDCIVADDQVEPLADWQWLYSYYQAMAASEALCNKKPLPKSLIHGLDPVSVPLSYQHLNTCSHIGFILTT